MERKNIFSRSPYEKAIGNFFQQTKPAFTFIEVSRLIDPEWLVEIEAECELR